MKISLVVATTASEVDLLEQCVKSVEELVDEIVIFDMSQGSEKVKDLAGFYKARIITQSPVEYIEKIRNKMINSAKGEWVLILDPDERVSKELIKVLRDISIYNKYNAVNIPRKNIIFGEWIRNTNWWPDHQIRFFKKDCVQWKDEIHSYPQVKGPVFKISAKNYDSAIEHRQYKNISEFLDRQNRYSNAESKNRIDNGEIVSIFTLAWWPLREILARYIKHKGYKDGSNGFILVYLMAIYKVTVWIKMWEKQRSTMSIKR